MYSEWRACERFGILPSGIARGWDECNIWARAKLLGYDQVREHEEFEIIKAQMAAGKVK